MISVRLATPFDVKGWREAARRLRLNDVAPDQVRWGVGEDAGLFADNPLPEAPPGAFTVPKAFVPLADAALLNRAEDRFDLMYRLLVRLKHEPNLLAIVTDPEVDRACGYRKSVDQAAHKMHAFLRFRRVDEPQTPETEEFAAWFEPPHYVLERAVGWFVERLANVLFTVVTPDATAIWNKKALMFGPGGDFSQVPADDAKEAVWKTYFTSIFNPARLNPKVMTQHMAKHYWRNLPEASLIPQMVHTAEARERAMVAATPDQTSAPRALSPRALKIAARRSRDTPNDTGVAPENLEMIEAEIQHCRRCELWRDATQAVPGVGPGQAGLMFVGEQPGDVEDLRGLPFVGPAGALFDRALAEAGVDRAACYVTNAVKHFKHEQRGKRRLHKTPGAGEVKACRWWLENERRLVRPKVIVALGSTAANAVLGRAVSVLKERGPAEALEGGGRAFLTVHPSYLLRLPDETARQAAFGDFVRDLKAAKALVAA